jgi:uncharacterized protein (TIGR02099 family)
MPGLTRRLWRLGAGVLAAVVILLAVAIGLVRLALVQVPEYRDQIEAWAGEALGWPVEIGTMDARLGWRGPEFRFTDARVMTRDGEQTLVVTRGGSMQLDLGSLLRGQPRPGAVSLAGVSLRVERTMSGGWRLLGEDGPVLHEGEQDMAGRAGGLPGFTEWPAGLLRLEDVDVEVEDLRKGLDPWLFRVRDLELRLGSGQLSVAASGNLPAALGADLSLSVLVTSLDERGRPRDWTAGVSFHALDLQALGEAIGRADLPAGGLLDGNLSAAADATGLRRVAGDLLARGLGLPSAGGALSPPGDEANPEAVLRAPDLPYERLGAKFEWTRSVLGWEAQLRDLEVARNGRGWLSRAVALVFEKEGADRRLEVRADRVDLEDLLPAAPWLPPRARDIAIPLAPAGTVRNLEMHLDYTADGTRLPEMYLDAQFERLAVAPLGRWPGLQDVSGSINGDTYGGAASLAHASAVSLPWMFRESLRLAHARAAVEWSRDEAGVRIDVPSFDLGNDDAEVSGRVQLQLPADGASPKLEIDAVARNVRLEAGSRYLPVSVMPPTVVEWLDHALVGGRVDEAQVVFRGETRAFPFREGGGEFKAEFDLVGGELDFQRGWPRATGIDAAVRFGNEGLWAEIRAARLLEVAAGPVSVALPDMARGMLQIDGKAGGRLAALREFALATDLLEGILGAGLEPALIGGGRVSADVNLRLPLRSLADYRARVDLQVRSGVVGYGFLEEPLRDVDARISIDNARVTARNVTATLAGSRVAANVSVASNGAVRIDSAGRIDAPALGRLLGIPLDPWVEGESDWQGFLQFPAPGVGGPLEVEIHSRLEGMAIDLPDPFRKQVRESRRIHARATFPGAGQMHAELEWDKSLRIAARGNLSGPEFRFVPTPGEGAGDYPGIVFSGAVARLDLGEWLAIDWPGGGPGGAGMDALAGGRLLIGELTGPMLYMQDVLLDVSRAGDRWQVGLAAERAAGRVEIPIDGERDQPVIARLERLWLESGPLEAVPAEIGAGERTKEPRPTRIDPASIPTLDIEIGDLRLGAIQVGRVSARVLQQGDGFELVGLEAVGTGFVIDAEGSSRLSDTVDASRLAIRMRSDDVGGTLDFLGFRRSMDAREALFESTVEWQGGLNSDWLHAIAGTASISIRDGRLVGVEPGAGRVFGLLSIQALPRRLALDFKDVFGEGTSFDRIGGDFRISGGNAFTDNLVMQGPAADLIVYGRTGLVARDYDQTAVIGADVGRAFPVAGAVVGGPAVGAALYLLSEVFRKPFQAQITYRLTGTWENPVIERESAGTLGPMKPTPRVEGAQPGAGAG